VDAAGHEFDVGQQKALLRAAAYGRAFCTKVPRDHFRETCKVGTCQANIGAYDILVHACRPKALARKRFTRTKPMHSLNRESRKG
jgi:hypothetical protein